MAHRRSSRGRGSLALATCAIALIPGAAGRSQKDKPSQKEISRELRELYESDQRDQDDPAWTEANDAEFSRRQQVRRDRVMQIIEAGMLAGPEDWDCAAMLLQHGSSAEDYLLAHVLSLPPGIAALPNSRFMCAATLDRFLQTIGRAQVFTTQSGAADPSVYAPMEPFDDSMNERLRAVFGLKPLSGRPGKPEKNEKKKGKGPSAKDLSRFLKLAREGAPSDPVPEWLAGTRAIVLAGALEREKDFELAARILLCSREPDDLLSAHVLAMGLAFQGRDAAARLLCAETLDRFLLAIGRPQLFDRVVEGGAPKEPRAPLQEFIRREYAIE